MKKQTFSLGALSGILLLVTAAGCAIWLIQYYHKSHAVKQEQEALAVEFHKTAGEGQDSVPAEDNTAQTEAPPDYQAAIAKLKEKNSDVAGWIQITGTGIDYPVVQGTDNDYYLSHSFEGVYNRHGAVFQDYRTDKETAVPHRIIYGHCMKDGTMFAALQSYKQERFLEEHPTITYINAQGEKEQYRIFSVCFWDNREGAFDYTKLFGIVGDTDYQDYVKAVQNQNIFRNQMEEEMGIEAGTPLLLLCTCDYRTDDSRLIVVGRLIQTVP